MAFMLSIRSDDESEWSKAEAYPTRKARDRAAAINRIIGGYRTHSYQESKAERKLREEAEAASERP